MLDVSEPRLMQEAAHQCKHTRTRIPSQLKLAYRMVWYVHASRSFSSYSPNREVIGVCRDMKGAYACEVRSVQVRHMLPRYLGSKDVVSH